MQDYNFPEKLRKEYVPIIVLNFLVKPKKIIFFTRFLGLNIIIFKKKYKIKESNEKIGCGGRI
jgi:hypothetical protein